MVRVKKRKEYEDRLRSNRHNITTWLKYAHFEEAQKDWERARSVYERALDQDYRNIAIWLKYAEMEMRGKFIQHARNVWERATKILPRVDQFWYVHVVGDESEYAGTNSHTWRRH